MLRWLLLLAVCSTVGCARARVVRISTIPADATLRIDDSNRGRGPLTETFTFGGDTVAHTVRAQRVGYKEQVVTIHPDFPSESLVITLKPVSRRVTIRVEPVPAIVRVDGKKLAADPVTELSTELEFPQDAAGKWVTHRLRAEHPKFDAVEHVVTYDDRKSEYVLDLAAKRKDLHISTVPPGAEVFVNDQTLGHSTVDYTGFAFHVDAATGEFLPQTLRIEKAGYQTLETQIGWDDGQQDYEFRLEPQSKNVRIVTDPPDARVTLDGVDVPLDESGAHTAEVDFVPTNDAGDLPTFSCVVTKEERGAAWERKQIEIAWDDGRTDYEVKLERAVGRGVPMLRVRTAWAEAGGWFITGEKSSPVGTFDTAEKGPNASKPRQITRLAGGTMIDTLAVSPDGLQLVFTTVSLDSSGGLRSQILAQPSDGAADAVPLTGGQGLVLTPAFTPDGSQVVFASNRGGAGKLAIWSVSATGDGGEAAQLTRGESNDLWPSVDSNPKPRLFYESLLDARGESRLLAAALGADAPAQDLAPPGGGTQPRVGPKADAVVFAAATGPKGERDIFRMSDTGDAPTNLTNTPDADDFNPVWAGDGRRVAFASNRDRSAEAPDNHDIYILDVTKAGAAEPVRVTSNGSWDDCPAWDEAGRAVYFRSNRGGEWNVWRVDLK